MALPGNRLSGSLNLDIRSSLEKDQKGNPGQGSTRRGRTSRHPVDFPSRFKSPPQSVLPPQAAVDLRIKRVAFPGRVTGILSGTAEPSISQIN